MDKRAFLKKASLMAVLTSFGLTLESCAEEDPQPTSSNPLEIDLNASPFTTLKSDGGWLLHPDRDILFVNVGGSISAFSSVCTHQGCARNWSFNGDFVCSCHGSSFSTSGAVTSGPASRALTKLAVTREGDTIKIG